MVISLYCYRVAIGCPARVTTSGTASKAFRQQLLRACLSHHTTGTPQDWQFEVGAYGKPALIMAQQLRYKLQFNLSHSQHWLVLAVAEGAAPSTQIGVDVEVPKAKRNTLEIARHCFAESEWTQLQALASTAATAAFYRLWVLKESYVKATGRGLTQALSAFNFSPVIAAERPVPQWEVVDSRGVDDNYLWRHFYIPWGSGHVGLTVGEPHPVASGSGPELQIFVVEQLGPEQWQFAPSVPEAIV
ncbi:4'-phosphopantetheinyl transferase family protein [Shewanella dokdonensis]|uniref:4'-phosphopantetheinyl transferase family protein n=1 Tax=Shewanella dokdonensis TaxID=712036 RepID=UPI00200EFBBB|nr:4'-phosphopantetheinyl transferase superfamily protein [Shewanella dokdonensis]MCL1073600.1 4'-phosphopantetheinyl transferase superfamily protein [Shewanella dokdonensis]